MFRRFGLALSVGLVLVGAVAIGGNASAAETAPSSGYIAVDLGTLPGDTTSSANAINNRGQIVGTSGSQAVLWDHGTISKLPTPAGTTTSVANGINARGQIVGSVDTHAVVWDRGTVTLLTIGPGLVGPPTAFSPSSANAINARGEIAGVAGLWAARWASARASAESLKSNVISVAESINARGQIVGNANPYEHVWRPFLWNPATDGQVLVPAIRLSGQPCLFYSANGINDRAQIVGGCFLFFVLPPPGEPSAEAVVLDAATGTSTGLLPLPGDAGASAYAINNRGQVVGSSDNHAVLWERGMAIQLNGLAGAGGVARAINERGQVVGTSRGHAVQWNVR
jgi:uncharacterized membrane protein